MPLKLYNTKSRKIEEFIPLHDHTVGMYSCGPTVYDYQHIGNMRKYVNDDILVRVLKNLGYKLTRVMNITDVGHLTSDEDSGIDKMEKGARKFGLSVWDVAKKFENQFWDSFDKVGNIRPDEVMHATDYIKEQIDLISKLEEKGYTYIIDDGVYFDTSLFPDYFKFSRQNPDELKKGARVEFKDAKKNISDFALWKFSPKNEKRQMEWESPWGIGFPGWHIECSAMSMKALGKTFDIHTGGIEHIPVHHTNEIAQSECATGHEFVRYWLHSNHLLVDGGKMSKSLGNTYTVEDLEKKGVNILSLRYFYLQAHYRQEQNFTFDALDAASAAYKKLLNELAKLKSSVIPMKMGIQNIEIDSRLRGNDNGTFKNEFMENFENALYDDLNTARALAVMWELVKSDVTDKEKLATLQKMDEILGLQLFESVKGEGLRVKENIPEEIKNLVAKREEYRKNKDFKAADEVRRQIDNLGFIIEDSEEGVKIKEK